MSVEKHTERVAELIYDQNPERWLVYGPEDRRSMVPWDRLKPDTHARKQALRDAEKIVRAFLSSLADDPPEAMVEPLMYYSIPPAMTEKAHRHNMRLALSAALREFCEDNDG